MFRSFLFFFLSIFKCRLSFTGNLKTASCRRDVTCLQVDLWNRLDYIRSASLKPENQLARKIDPTTESSNLTPERTRIISLLLLTPLPEERAREFRAQFFPPLHAFRFSLDYFRWKRSEHPPPTHLLNVSRYERRTHTTRKSQQ